MRLPKAIGVYICLKSFILLTYLPTYLPTYIARKNFGYRLGKLLLLCNEQDFNSDQQQPMKWCNKEGDEQLDRANSQTTMKLCHACVG